MKDISLFLEEIAASRSAWQAAASASFVPPSGLVLPEMLEIALGHRFLLSPVLARSRLAMSSARIGVPSRDRAQIEYWYVQYGDHANWLLETGASSGIVVLEVDPSIPTHASDVIGDKLSCQRTLRFDAHGKKQLLFEYVRGLSSFRSYPGIRIHSGSSILIPPSRTTSGVELVYEDPHAPLLSADWLREAVSAS